MNKDDAVAVIESLLQKAFTCGDDFIETDNGYIIKKTHKNHRRSANNE